MARAVEAFETSRQKTALWLKDVARELHTEDRHRAYAALRAVLHALRDCMPIEEAVKFSGQMPLILKGVFFDGWKARRKPERLSRVEFYGRVRERLRGVALDGAPAARAVLRALDRHMSTGELEGVKRILPGEVRELWRALDEEGEHEGREGRIPPPGLGGRPPGAGSLPMWP